METRNLGGQFAYLNRRVHDPDRLAILTALSVCEQADLRFLQRITGFTGETLSFPLSKLEKAGLVEIEERFVDIRSLVRLTAAGRQTIEIYQAEEGLSRRELCPPAAAEGRSGAVPAPGTAEGRATRFGLTVYEGGRKKRSDR
ncbi:MAG TPA: transcriptional regulator [Thermoanaerobaculia bacterium]|nr:transcriptional regulator [Thermoanaerobaculia bacterium]